MANISQVIGREILDSRGNPTVEAEVTPLLYGSQAPDEGEIELYSNGNYEEVEQQGEYQGVSNNATQSGSG